MFYEYEILKRMHYFSGIKKNKIVISKDCTMDSLKNNKISLRTGANTNQSINKLEIKNFSILDFKTDQILCACVMII